MLLRPRKETDIPAEKGSIESLDAFDHPVPGQSLTDEPGRWAFEKPPQIVDVDEAVAYVVDKVETSNGGKEELQKQMMAGMPIESIVNTIAFTGFTDGQWNPDVAEMIKLPLSAYFMMMAQEENIPAIMFNQDPSEDQGMSDETVMAHMQEGNPRAYAHLQQQMDIPPEEDAQMMPEGFLAMPPEDEVMELEEQPMIEGEGMI
jgi:hypothetical protein